MTTLVSGKSSRAGFPWRFAILGSAVWAIFNAVVVLAALFWQRQWGNENQVLLLSLLYGAGALLAFIPSLRVSQFFRSRRMRILAFAILLALGTIGFTAVLLGLEYRAYFSQWHGAPFSRIWLWQQTFTFLGSTFQYVVLGLRLYWPFGLLALALISWWTAKKVH